MVKKLAARPCWNKQPHCHVFFECSKRNTCRRLY